MKLLSISIPTYNRNDLVINQLEQLYQIIIADNLTEFVEIVITDNNSLDSTFESLINFKNTHRKIDIKIFKNQSNLGIDGNIHKAVLNSSSEYVHILSDDDSVDRQFYSILINFLKANSVSFLFLDPKRFTNHEKGITASVSTLSKNKFHHVSVDELFLIIGHWLTFVSSYVVSRDFWCTREYKIKRYHGTDILLCHAMAEIIRNDRNKIYICTFNSIVANPMYTGSFRLFNAFAKSWQDFLIQSIDLFEIKNTGKVVFKKTVKYFLPACVRIAKVDRLLKLSDVIFLIKHCYTYHEFWIWVFPEIIIPTKISQIYIKLKGFLYEIIKNHKNS